MIGAQQTDVAQAQDAAIADMQPATVELRAVLDAEREALDRHDSIALDAATSSKAQLLQRLESLDAERRQLEQLAPAHAPSAPWPQICLQLGACRRINEINGSIVTQQLAFVRRALSVLRGSGEGPPALYGPAGHAQASAFPRPLSQA